MKEAAAVADLLGHGACIVDPELLPAVQNLCDALPRIQDAWELLADLSAALDNALLHHGGAMPPGDALRCRHLVERVERFLAAG